MSTSRNVLAVLGLVPLVLQGAVAGPGHHAPAAPAALTVDDRATPLNVEGAPLFGWPVPSGTQTAYEIRVTRAGVPTWDSGRVAWVSTGTARSSRSTCRGT
jgi:alpha-L-rhamnosidase